MPCFVSRSKEDGDRREKSSFFIAESSTHQEKATALCSPGPKARVSTPARTSPPRAWRIRTPSPRSISTTWTGWETVRLDKTCAVKIVVAEDCLSQKRPRSPHFCEWFNRQVFHEMPDAKTAENGLISWAARQPKRKGLERSRGRHVANPRALESEFCWRDSFHVPHPLYRLKSEVSWTVGCPTYSKNTSSPILVFNS